MIRVARMAVGTVCCALGLLSTLGSWSAWRACQRMAGETAQLRRVADLYAGTALELVRHVADLEQQAKGDRKAMPPQAEPIEEKLTPVQKEPPTPVQEERRKWTIPRWGMRP